MKQLSISGDIASKPQLEQHVRRANQILERITGPTVDQVSADWSLQDPSGRMVLLVLYTVPESRPRLRDLALGGDALDLQDLEIIFAPTDADPGAIRRLGPEPRLLFPVVTGGAADIVQASQGYLRA